MALGCDPLQHRSMYQREEDSEDSDGEGGMGNVSRLLVRPPGHSGKAKKGHLCFDASFETGNLGRVDLINELEYDLYIRPDTCNPRYRFWFNFTVDNFKIDQKVVFNIINISKSRNLFRSYLTPVVKSSSRPFWQRIPTDYVWYHKSSAHRGHYILSFAFTFDKEDDIFQFALTSPYSYSRCQNYLNAIDKRAKEYLVGGIYKKEKMAESIQKRYVDMISIGCDKTSEKMTKLSETQHLEQLETNELLKTHVIIIIARTHGADAPTSFVCQGVLEFLISSHPIASILRENAVFKIVPMLNPDGVFLGNYKTTLMGYDLNRYWNNATAFSHPTLYSLIQIIKDIDQNQLYQLDFIIDIHANTTLPGCFFYGNTYHDIYKFERHIVFQKLFSQNAFDYCQKYTMYNRDANKLSTCRRHFSDFVNCYTLNVSFSGYFSNNNYIPYTSESYKRIGRNLIKTFLDYYKLIGVIANDLENMKFSMKKQKKQKNSAKKKKHQLTYRKSACSTSATSQHRSQFLSLNIAELRSDFVDDNKNNNIDKKQIKLKLNKKELDNNEVAINVSPKPSLTIIDFNQMIIASFNENEPHHLKKKAIRHI